MNKLLKIIILIFIISALLLGIAITLLVTLVDQNEVKDRVSKFIYNKTGRQLKIVGEVNWSFFPWLGVKANNVILSNGIFFKNGDFATVGEVDVKLKPLALFSGKVEVGKFLLKDLDLHLIKNTSGYANWQDLVVVADTSQKNKATTTSLTNTTISSIEVTNGKITWENRETNKLFEIRNFNLSSDGINFNKPFEVNSSFSFQSHEPQVSGEVDLNGKVTLDIKNKQYIFRDLKLTGKLQDGVLVNPLDFSGSADVVTDLNQQDLRVKNLSLQLADMRIAGSAHGINIIDAPNVLGDLTVSNFDATEILHALGFRNIPAAWKKVETKVSFETTSKFLKLPKIAAKLGDMQVSGSGSYSHFTDKYVVFNFNTNKLDLDSLRLESESPIKKPASTILPSDINKKVMVKPSTTISNVVNENSIFLAVMRAIKLNGDLKIAALNFNKINLTNVVLQVEGNHGLIKVDPFNADLYRGKANAGMTIDFRTVTPILRVKLNLSGVSLQDVLVDFADFHKISGIFSLQGNFLTTGSSSDALFHNLNGAGKITLRNGVYDGVDIGYQIRKASAMLNQKPLPKESDALRTNFGSLSASFKIANGLVTNNDLLINAPEFRGKGNGTINLITKAINFRLSATATHDENLFIPVEITNTFADPKVKIDMAALVAHTMKKVMQQQLNKLHLINELGNKGVKPTILKALPLDKILGK